MKKIFLLLFLFLPLAAGAHGDSTAQSQVVGDKKIELEYSAIGEIKAGEFVGYMVHLFSADTGEQLPFDSAFIRIVSGKLAVLSGKAAYDPLLEEGGAIISGSIPKAGEHAAQITVFKDSKALPTAEFKLNVSNVSAVEVPKAEEGTGIDKNNLYIYLGIFVGGFVLGILFKPLLGSRM